MEADDIAHRLAGHERRQARAIAARHGRTHYDACPAALTPETLQTLRGTLLVARTALEQRTLRCYYHRRYHLTAAPPRNPKYAIYRAPSYRSESGSCSLLAGRRILPECC